MQYWLIYNDSNDLIGYSTYKQFKGQTYVNELPEKFVMEEKKRNEILESKSFLDNTLTDVLDYLEDIASDENPKMSKQQFKDLCLERKKAKNKLKD